jgi:hypothetical protein
MRKLILVVACALVVAGGIAVYSFEELRVFSPFRPYPASVQEERALIDARRKLPLVSVASRLPQGKAVRPGAALSDEAKAYWEDMEKEHARNDRGEMLRALHEKTRNVFVDRPGAGKGRMLETPQDILFTEWNVGDQAQPGTPSFYPLSSGDAIERVEPAPTLRSFHQSNVYAFFPARNFGYIKDRDQVAGFRPHGFRWVNQAAGNHRLEHVLLIGILSHEQPVVYMTEKLPSMEKVKDTPTRALDFVEASGLSALRDGDDLYVVGKEDALRMIGALRATKTCQKCHDAEVGDLLGAFSYSLRKVEKKASGS